MKSFKVFSAICLFALLSLVSGGVWGQVSITSIGSNYSQDFNTLAISGTSNLMPTGWFFNETGTGANATYSAGNGSVNSGDTYSYGSTSSSERSLGTLLSGSVTSMIGASFVNNSGFAINSIGISFVGEQWRLGATGRLDKLDFQYSIDATSISNGTWTDMNSLDFIAPTTTGTVGVLDGNISANRVSIASVISGLSIANGVTFSVRWTDFNSTGADDGLGIDDFSLIVQDATLSGNASISNITMLPNSLVTLQSGSELTLNGTLTNNGTLTLENGATLVQGANSTYSGTGTVQVKQNITGANNGSSPNGRFWYLGSPVSGGLSSILDAAGANVVKYWDEPSAAWVEITDNTSALTVGRGHYLRSFTPGNQTLTFTGGALNNGTYTLPLTANGASFNGFNLVSNPYPSYLKWDDVAKNNVGTTIWYRTSNGANNMVFDTYNSNGNVGTSNNGVGTVSQFIPPMQAFWVKVEGNTSGSIVLENIDRSHHVSGMQGMHSLLDKQMFANINLIKDTLRDQAIVYSSYTTADVFDAYDSEKMFQANIPQLYSKINDKKVVINAKNFMQRNEKMPLFMNIPNAGTYTMQLGEFNSSFGSIWLEDLSNGQLQNLLINDTYTFETEAGQDLARFVLHFGYPEQIYGTDVFESVEENFDSPVNWNDVNVVATDEKIIDLTASLNELDAQQTNIVSVFDMTGRQIMTGTFENGINQIQVPASNAVYMVHVSVGSAHKVFKVLIQE